MVFEQRPASGRSRTPDESQTEFTIELDVRADEESAFVPAELVPGAGVGDIVTVRSAYLDGRRTGTVVEVVDDETRGRFHRVTFE